MDMESSGPFLETNKKIARYYWYGAAGCAALFAVLRTIRCFRAYYGALLHQRNPHIIPSRPSNRNSISSTFATLTAIAREISYPQPIHLKGSFAKHLSPPPVGRTLIVLIYWILILLALWKDVVLTPDSPLYAYKWEKVAFRAAWVSVTQLPMVYLLSCKHNIISWITGISYERLNWMHRWSAITLFFTIIVHWAFFFREWTLGDIVSMELSMMPMVRYGFAAWAVIGWMVITSFGFFRQLAYEFFVVQHILAAFVLLWLVHTHVPSYAAYNVWMAVGFVVLDRSLRLVLFTWRNAHSWRPGYDATLELLPGRAVEMTIKDVSFKWKPGQHIYIWVPSLGLLENHPFTITNNPENRRTPHSNDIKLVIKVYAGFSTRLYDKCANAQSITESCNIRVFVSGPWGHPPVLRPFDTVVLIASGSGAAFTTPLLESLASSPGFARRIEFNWIIPSAAQLKWFERQLNSALQKSEYNNTHILINVFVSRGGPDGTTSPLPSTPTPKEEDEKHMLNPSSPISSSSLSTTSTTTPTISLTYHHHPTPSSLILPALERALGETAVVVCGNAGLIAEVRTYVAWVSDQRAVHKGTGAQGVEVFSEGEGW